MRMFTALVFGVASLASSVASAQVHAQPGYVHPGYTRGPGWYHSNNFAMRLRTRMNEIERDVRRDVNTGRVAPAALGALSAERQQVEQRLSVASSDGWIAPPERRQLNMMVDRMERIDTRFSVGRGGGPFYRGPHYRHW